MIKIIICFIMLIVLEIIRRFISNDSLDIGTEFVWENYQLYNVKLFDTISATSKNTLSMDEKEEIYNKYPVRGVKNPINFVIICIEIMLVYFCRSEDFSFEQNVITAIVYMAVLVVCYMTNSEFDRKMHKQLFLKEDSLVRKPCCLCGKYIRYYHQPFTIAYIFEYVYKSNEGKLMSFSVLVKKKKYMTTQLMIWDSCLMYKDKPMFVLK